MYSVIIPCYNTPVSFQNNLSILIERFIQEQLLFEIILIDDCSQTQIVYNSDELIYNYRNEKNLGQDKSIVEGIKKAKGDVIVTIDDDFQFTIDDVIHCIKIKEENKQLQLVAGVSKNIFRFIDLIAVFIYWLIKLRGLERISSLRLFDKKLCQNIEVESQRNLFSLSIFLQMISNKKMYFIIERYSNNATRYNIQKLIKFIITIFWYKPKVI